MDGNHDNSPPEVIEADIIAAREMMIEVWTKTYARIVPPSEFEIIIADEAHQLAEFAVGADTRTHCILLVSFLEDALRKNFIEAWGIRGRTELDKYFGSNGPLSTFAQQTLASKGLRWLSVEEAAEMDVLRKIRNALAHDHRTHALEDTSLLGWASSLAKREEIWTKSNSGYSDAFKAASTETKLRMRVFCSGMFLVRGALSRAKRIAAGLHPDFRTRDGWEGMLWIEQSLLDAAIRHSWRSLGLAYQGAVYQSPSKTNEPRASQPEP